MKSRLLYASNTDTDQPVHLRRLISSCVIRYLKRIIVKLVHVNFFNALAVTEQTGFQESCVARIPKDRVCCHTRPIVSWTVLYKHFKSSSLVP